MKNGWIMNDGDIATMYRQAKDRREQIKILSDLNCRTTVEVVDKLHDLGFPDANIRVRKPYKRRDWTDEEVRKLVAMRNNGFTYERCSYELGKTIPACHHKMYEVKGSKKI